MLGPTLLLLSGIAPSCASYEVRLIAREEIGLGAVAVEVVFSRESAGIVEHLADLTEKRKIHVFFSDEDQHRRELADDGKLLRYDVVPGQERKVDPPDWVDADTTIIVVANLPVPPDSGAKYEPYFKKRVQEEQTTYRFRLGPGSIEFVKEEKRP